MVKTFKENNLYYLKESDSEYFEDIELTLCFEDEIKKFSNTGLKISNKLTIGRIVKKLIDLGVFEEKEIRWGSSAQEAMKNWNLKNESEFLKESYDLVTSLFENSVFKNVHLVTGEELNHQIEIIKEAD